MSWIKPVSAKEMSAINFNQKQQQWLEKALHTLHLEEGYSLKLLNMDHRVLRVNFQRLKDRVSKIQSHLSAQDVAYLRRLDENGKLCRSTSSAYLSSSSKIAAAAKRLGYNSTNDAKPPTNAAPKLPAMHQTLNADGRRRHSITGALIDAPMTDPTARSNSMTDLRQTENKNGISIKGRKMNRPITSMERQHSHPKSKGRPKTAAAPTSRRALYSSHSVSVTEANTNISSSTNRPGGSRRESLAYLMDDIESNLGDDMYEEKRLRLLDAESEISDRIESKRQEFLKKLDEYFEENPHLEINEQQVIFPIKTNPFIETEEPVAKVKSRPRINFDTARSTPDEGNKRKLYHHFKDLNKCRYLRIDNDLIDLSGVVTLVREQQRHFQIMRHMQPSPFLASAQV